MDKKEALSMPAREGAPPKQRRVYKTVSVGEPPAGLFCILLDGKPAMTPQRAPLASRHRALADAVAAEWNAQDPYIDPRRMPLTRLLATALDRVAPQRAGVIESLLSYVDADMLCYRATHPADLRDRQRQKWQPVLDWLLQDLGIGLSTFEGLMPGCQTAEVGLRMRRHIEALDDGMLNAFQATAGITHSLALAFAMVRGRLTPQNIFENAVLDEVFQAEKWGEDAYARERRLHIAAELDGIARYIALVRA